eukprot:TRINITY_DN10455_c0_g1_i9.p1 TRINITY_DN10455_c0_g1~~TRINITY_DN10455_c0_g1_i9.p1  ORF type:complete len:142 (-),score=39.15 TRINITY_DN10455_c0_g1_i9:37-462(-)
MLFFVFFFFFFFKQKTAYEMQRGLVGSEMCIRDRVKIGRPWTLELQTQEVDISSVDTQIPRNWMPQRVKAPYTVSTKLTEAFSESVSYTHLRAHETSLHLVCRLLLEKKKKKKNKEKHDHPLNLNILLTRRKATYKDCLIK